MKSLLIKRNIIKIRFEYRRYEMISRHSLDEDGRDDGIAVASDVLPGPLDVADLVARQFGLGINQIFGVPIKLNEYY